MSDEHQSQKAESLEQLDSAVSDPATASSATEVIAEPRIIRKAAFSRIWFLPIVALLIGLWMVYSDWQNRGIHIQISFDTAEGLVAEKTLLKNRNVDIGQVSSIRFNEDKSKILVDVEVDQDMRDFLQTDSKFWVVRPRVGIEGISGVGTLLTGAYIQVVPGESGEFSDRFTGLNSPPVTAENIQGLRLKLVSRGGKQLRIGDPVIYSGFEVGRVETFNFDPELREASYGIFIQAPYDELVTENTFFWNVSGVTVSTTAEGISIDVASLDTFIRGGVEFDVTDGAIPGEPARALQVFELFNSKQNIAEQRSYSYIEYVVLVEDSVGGLYKGAAVEYRGIRIGTVESPFLSFDQVEEITNQGGEDRIPVVVRIEPERLSANFSNSLDDFRIEFDNWIKGGLTGYIATSNLLTGSLKVNLSPDGEQRQTIDYFGSYPVIPSGQGAFANISNKVESVLDKFEQLPIESLLAKLEQLDIETLLENINGTVETADSTLLALEHTLKELDETLNGLEPNSSVYRSIEETMETLQTTLDSLKPLVQEISNTPSSLVFGKSKTPDTEPRASSYSE